MATASAPTNVPRGMEVGGGEDGVVWGEVVVMGEEEASVEEEEEEEIEEERETLCWSA